MKKLIFFGFAKIEDILAKGNVWYVRHYEAYFDEVYVVYLSGGPHREIRQGKTTLVSLGTGSGPLNGVINLILAPYRLYRFTRKVRPTNYLTADLVFSWWTAFLIRLLIRAKIYLMPVCIPEQIKRDSGRSVSGFLPTWLENIFLKLSFFSAHVVLTSRNWGSFIDWLLSLKYIQRKLKIVVLLAEEIPSFEFCESSKESMNKKPGADEFILLSVGRLHPEKMTDDLIKMLFEIKKRGFKVRLKIIGDGPDRKNLENLAIKLGVREQVDFLGSKPNHELIRYYKNADIFVSPLTGTSLREAALCRLPVVAYNIQWVKGTLKHEANVLLVEARKIEDLASSVIRLLTDKPLREKIADNLYKFALKRWDTQRAADALKETFEL